MIMPSTRQLVAAAGLCVAIAIPATGAAQSLDGAWISEQTVHVRGVSGEETVTATLQMILSQHADSLRGTVQLLVPGLAAPEAPREISGSVQDGRVVIVDRMVAQVAASGPAGIGEHAAQMEVVRTYDLRIEGDELVGTESAVMQGGAFTIPTKPFRARRAAG